MWLGVRLITNGGVQRSRVSRKPPVARSSFLGEAAPV